MASGRHADSPRRTPAAKASPTLPSTPPGVGRLAWVDAARGICVLGVVLFHVCTWQYLPLGDALWHPAAAAWDTVNSYLGTFRMPLLMALSGMLAARRVGEGWGRPGALIRAASSSYLYVVWLMVYTMLYALLPDPDLPHRIDSIGAFFGELLMPQTPLWYVFALALYVVVLTSLRRVPAPVVLAALAALAALSVIVLAAEPDWPMFEKVPENAVYFAVGVYLGRHLQSYVAQVRSTKVLLWAVVGIGCAALSRITLGAVPEAMLRVAFSLVSIVLGAVVVSVLVRIDRLARWGEYVGRRTLQIYVLHIPLLFLVLSLVHSSGWLVGLLGSPLLSVSWPLLLATALVAACLLLHRTLLAIRLGALFEMPHTFTTGLTRLHTALRRHRHPVSVPSESTDRRESST